MKESSRGPYFSPGGQDVENIDPILCCDDSRRLAAPVAMGQKTYFAGIDTLDRQVLHRLHLRGHAVSSVGLRREISAGVASPPVSFSSLSPRRFDATRSLLGEWQR